MNALSGRTVAPLSGVEPTSEDDARGASYARLAASEQELREVQLASSLNDGSCRDDNSRYSLDWRSSAACWAGTCPRRPRFLAWALVLGGCGFLGPALVDWRFRKAISSSARLEDHDSPSFATWNSNAGPGGSAVQYNVHYFHLTNPEEVTYHGAKPIVVDKGPCYLRV